MSWADNVMASLDERATAVRTERGPVQLGREGTGPPVLAIHGGPGGFDQALAWCRHLRDGGCEVLAPSRPGYLRTPLDSGRSPSNQADLYAALLDTLGVERTSILGFSSGAPSAVWFAARYPERTKALFLDTAILFPFTPPVGGLRRATYESAPFVWLAYQLAARLAAAMARFMIDGVSTGLSSEQKREQARWITSDRERLQSMQEQFSSIAPRRYRRPGWLNDKANERDLAPLPFAGITSPTVVAYGVNDAIVPLDHAVGAAERIADSKLVPVAAGHHLLSLSRNYGSVAQLQLELAHG